MKTARTVLRKIFDSYKYILGSRLAAYNLRHIADSCDHDVEKLVDLAFNFVYKQKIPKSWDVSIKPLQVKSEITTLCGIVQKSNPQVIAEIGTASGGTLFLFAHIANPHTIISIDLPGGSFGGGYPTWKIPLFSSVGENIKLLRADSHSEETLKKTMQLLKGKKIDFLFIDGDHTYNGVKQDFQMYSPLVRKGGIVAFHDIVAHESIAGCEVDKFWHEIKQNYRYSEIIEDMAQKWAGIGILYL